MTRKTKLIYYFILGFTAIIYLALTQYYGKQRDLKHYDFFYNSNLSGIIEKVEIKYHAVAIKLTNSNNQYVFSPITSKHNNNKIFIDLANIGDSIIKPSNSDTLILIKNNNRFKYTFQKYKK